MYLCGNMHQNFLPFLRLNNDPLYVYPTFSILINPSMALGCFFLLVIVNKAAVNMGVQIGGDGLFKADAAASQTSMGA